MSTEPSRSRTRSSSLTLAVGRHSAVPLETRGALARFDTARGVLELHGAAKRPHWNRDQLAEIFGIRAVDDRTLRKSRRWRLRRARRALPGRSSGVLRGAQAPPSGQMDRGSARASDVRQSVAGTAPPDPAAVDCNGRILAIDETVFHDQGAYVRTHGARVADMTIGLLLGPYRVPNYRAAAHYPTDQQDACCDLSRARTLRRVFRSRASDRGHRPELGIEAMEVRRRNLIASLKCPMRAN